METKSVWVIEQGVYSDYHVVGVFSSKENAEAVFQLMSYKDYNKPEIKEWPLDPYITNLHMNLNPWYGIMRRDGMMEMCRIELGDDQGINGVVPIARQVLNPTRNPNTDDCVWGYVWAKDEQHAVKIFNEHRVQFIASDAWK